MRKLILALVTLGVVLALGYILIPTNNSRKPIGYSEALNAIPQQSTFIIRGENLIKKWGQFASSTFGYALQKTNTFSTVSNLFLKVDSVEDDPLSNFFGEKVFIAGVLTAGNQLNYLVSLESSGYGNEQVTEYVNMVIGSKPLSSKEYALKIIHTYSLNSRDIYFSQVGDVVLFSTSSILIEEGIRELSAVNHLPDQFGFRKLFKTADISSDGNFFINLSNIGTFLNMYGSSSKNFSTSMQNLGGWAELDLNLRDKSMMFNGFSFINDSVFSYLKSFEDELAQPLNVSSVLPENTGFLSYISFGSFKSYKKKYNQYLAQNQVLYKHQKNVLNINKKHTFNVEADFYSWIGDEVALFTISGDEKSYYNKTGLILKLADLGNAKDGLREIHKSSGANSPVEYQTITINDLGLTNFFPLTLGDEFKAIKETKYIIIEDYIVFANDESVLKHVINFYLRGKTLVKNIQFNKFYDQFSSESNLFYYCNIKQSINYFNSMLNESSLESFNVNLDSLKKLQAFGVQVNSNKKLFYTNAYVNYSSQESSQNLSLIEIKLDTTYSKKPWVVKNHYTNENEMLIQDDNHSLYLINNVGKILWKENLNEAIIGEIQQVDRYKNDKLQYVFTTPTKIHQIDRKGRYVSGYPVTLKAPITKGIVVFDYDKNRNYRMLVTQGRNLHNFGIDGHQVKGWNFTVEKTALTTSPSLIQIKEKDYIVVSHKSGKVRVLNRKGEDRIKLKNQLPSEANNHVIWNNKSLSSSGVLASDTNGTIYFVKLADELETFTIKAFEGDFNLYYQDFDGDKVIDFVVHNENKIQVYKNNKKLILEVADIEFKPAYGVESFNLPKGQKINIVADKNQRKIFGFDQTGELINSFPIDGYSPSLVTDLDGNGSYDLVVGDQIGSVYIYSLEN
jgi:hypothetical protein